LYSTQARGKLSERIRRRKMGRTTSKDPKEDNKKTTKSRTNNVENMLQDNTMKNIS
jgi:hypothetical protein